MISMRRIESFLSNLEASSFFFFLFDSYCFLLQESNSDSNIDGGQEEVSRGAAFGRGVHGEAGVLLQRRGCPCKV